MLTHLGKLTHGDRIERAGLDLLTGFEIHRAVKGDDHVSLIGSDNLQFAAPAARIPHLELIANAQVR